MQRIKKYQARRPRTPHVLVCLICDIISEIKLKKEMIIYSYESSVDYVHLLLYNTTTVPVPATFAVLCNSSMKNLFLIRCGDDIPIYNRTTSFFS